MRVSTLFTLASLFLLGSYSLPQPKNSEPSRTIEDREARTHDGGAEWWEHHKGGASGSSTNDTKIKERQPPEGMTWMEFMKHGKHHGGSGGSGNSTKVKMMKFRD